MSPEEEALLRRLQATRQTYQQGLGKQRRSPPPVFRGIDSTQGMAIYQQGGQQRVSREMITNGLIRAGDRVRVTGRGLNSWMDAVPRVRRGEVVAVERLPETEPRILALGNYYGFADAGYNSFPDNKTFALNIFNWLSTDRAGTRIATYSTDSLLANGGDISIDSPSFSSLQADLEDLGFVIETIDLETGDLAATLASCDVFFLPNILNPSYQLDTAQATLLADFTRQGKGLIMVSYNIQEPYTGIYEVFGINSILTGSDDEYFPVDPATTQIQPLLKDVDFYTVGGVNYIYADPSSSNTFYRLFDIDGLLEYNLGFVIELADS